MKEIPITVVKTTSIKVKNTKGKIELFGVFVDYTNTCKYIHRHLYEFSMVEYKDNTGKVVINPELTKQTYKLTSENEENLKTIFGDFISVKSPRDYANAFTLPLRKDSDSESIKRIKQTTSILPFLYDGNTYDPLNGQSGYKYAVIGSVHNRMTSFEECSKATNLEYLEIKDQFNTATAELIKLYGQEQFTALNCWIDEILKACKDNSRETIFHLNYKFISFFNQYLKEMLNKWNVDNSIIISNDGKWKNKNGENITFSCGKYVVELLKKYNILWKGDKLLLGHDNLGDYLELREKFLRKKEYSSYKDIDIIDSPVKMLLGNNYVKINTIEHNKNNATLNFTIGMPKSKSEDNKKNKLKIECAYKRVNHGKHYYLENLKIENEKNECGESTGNYRFTYSINGKKDRVSLLKEPSIRLVINNRNMDFNNPKYSDFDFYVDLSFNTLVQPCHNIVPPDLYKYRKQLSTSYPEKRGFGNQKIIKDKSTIKIANGTRFIGIDLGIKNPFAYGIYEYSDIGEHQLIKEGLLDNPLRPEDAIIGDFRALCRSIRILILQTKKYYNGDDKLTDEFLNKTTALFKKFNISLNINYIDYIKFIDDKRNNDINFCNIKKDQNWFIRQCITHARQVLIKLTNDRKSYSDYRKHFYWIKALEEYRKMFSSYNRSGTVMSDGPRECLCKSIYNRIDNLKTDYLKKLSSDIAEIAKSNNVCMVITEELSSMRGNKFDSKNKNQLFNLWPVGQIKQFIEHSVSVYGILKADVYEGNTSQVHAETGNWGYRGEKEEIDILYLPDDEIINADVNAAKNICLRYLNRHTDMRALSFCRVSDKYYIPHVIVEKKDGGRINGLLSARYGDSKSVFEISNKNYLKKSKITLKELKKKFAVQGTNKETWYAIDNTFGMWMSKAKRDEVVNAVRISHGK
jgi:IS605 OrfB family transposase